MAAGQRSRIVGLDVARGLAISGMVYAHLGPLGGSALERVDSALGVITSGFSSALFAVLAGVSLSLMSRRGVEAGGVAVAQARHQLMLRGALLMVVGTVLSTIQFHIAVVLSALGAVFLVLPAAVRWKSSSLWLLWAGLVLFGPMAGVGCSVAGTCSDVVSGNYPIMAWLAYGTTGMLIHRYLVYSPRVQVAAIVVGVVVAVLGVWLRTVLLGLVPDTVVDKYGSLKSLDTVDSLGSVDAVDIAAKYPPIGVRDVVYLYLGPEPHVGGVVDVLTSVGVAALVISACLLATRVPALRLVLYPLQMMGAMAFTVYVGHVLSAGLIIGDGMTSLSSSTAETYGGSVAKQDMVAHYPLGLVLTLLVAMICAALWLHFFRRGPVEWVMHVLVARGSRTDLPGVVRVPTSPTVEVTSGEVADRERH